jgi:cytoskeletal protein RodZ
MDIGTRLRQAREERGKTLSDVAEATKISPLTLEALERNEFGRMPGGIFARAFVRSCAVEVGLDPDPIVQEFIRAWPSAAPQSLADLEKDSVPRTPPLVRWIAVAGVLACLGAAATGAYFWAASAPGPARGATVSHGGSR